jgi:2-oxoacid dehydrogenases acyltransferase (catalytic domain)
MITFVGIKSIRGTLASDVDMTWAESLRSKLASAGHKTTVTAILVKAIAIAQRTHPLSRTMYLPFGRRAVFKEIAAGFTVEKLVNDQATVFFGTIDSPQSKSLEEITGELRQYAELPVADVPRLSREQDFSRMPWLLRRIVLWLGLNHPWVRLAVNQATFGLTSLGKFGVQMVVGPCSSTSTFGVGLVEMRPVVRNHSVVARPIMTLTLFFDHRVMDTVPAARFLKEVRDLVEGQLEEHLAPTTTALPRSMAR